MITKNYTAKSEDVNTYVTKALSEKGYTTHCVRDDDIGFNMCYSNMVLVYEGANPSMGILVVNYEDQVVWDVGRTEYLSTNIEAMFFNVDLRVQLRLDEIIEKAIVESEQDILACNRHYLMRLLKKRLLSLSRID